MVDLALAPEFRLERLNRHTARHRGTVATAFADLGIDKHPLVGVHPFATLAQAPPFCRAGLVVDDHRHTRFLAQLPLNGIKFRPVVQRHRPAKQALAVELLDLVGDERDTLNTFGAQLFDHLQRVNLAIMRLPAGHRHKPVVQQLVGHRGPRRDRRADRHQARMEISAVAHVGKDVLFVGKRILAKPHRALAAHMADRVGFHRIAEHRHRVTPDPR